MSVYCLDPLRDHRWTDFVERRPDASVFHTFGWLEALRRTYRQTPIAYTTSPPGAPLTNGLLFCKVHSWLTGTRLVSVPFADHCEPLLDSPDAGPSIMASIVDTALRERWRYIELRPIGPAVQNWSDSRRAASFTFHRIDLRPSADDLFRSLHRDGIQRKIRRAEREGLRYERDVSPQNLDDFFRLLLLTRRRHRVPPQPIEWFRSLSACFGNRLTIHNARNNDRVVASMLTLTHGRTIVYKYGGSDASVHNLGAVPFLFWRVLRDAKAAGLETFDLGRSDPDNSGLITFKDRLGATRSALNYWRWPSGAPSSVTSGAGAKLVREMLARMPDPLLVAAGRLLYRHAG